MKRVYNKEAEIRLVEIKSEIRAIRENRRTIHGYIGSDSKIEGIMRIFQLQEDQANLRKSIGR